MHWKTSALLLSAFLLAGSGYLASAGDDKKDAAVKKDKKALQGTWTTDKDNKAGIKAMTFDGNKLTVKGKDDETIDAAYTIDPTKKPKTIDIKITGGTSKGAEKYKDKIALGIYTFEGGKLKWCSNEPGRDERPTEFNGEKNVLVLFERAKK